jgi:hypothetical protein
MTHTFESCGYRRIRWGNNEAMNLGFVIAKYFESNPYTIVTEVDEEGNTVKIARFHTPLPDEIDRFAVAAAENLRSALDQAGWLATLLETGIDYSTRTHFPFAHSDSESERKRVRNGTSKHLPDEVFSLFWSFKPYPGGDDILWGLNKIHNTSEHRIIEPYTPQVTPRVRMGARPGIFNGGLLKIETRTWDSEKNQIVLATFKGDTGCKVDFAMAVRLHNFPSTLPAIEVFYNLTRIVKGIVTATEQWAKGRGLVT